MEHNHIKNDSEAVNLENLVQIKSRRILVSLSNGWVDLTKDNPVNVEAPNLDGICKGTSSLQFDKYMAHNLIAFNFKVEYSSELPTKPVVKTVNHTIGWSTFLPEIR
jgi:hypothetical protein